MKKLLIINCCCFLLLCTNLWFVGCSLIGLGIGGIIDPEKSTPLVEAESVRNLTKGSDVVIVKKNGEMVTGVFLTSTTLGGPLEVELYRTEYEKWRVQFGQDSCRLPCYGTSVRVFADVQLDRNRSAGEFAGIDDSTIWIREPFEKRYVPLPVEHVLEVIDSSGILVATNESILHALENGVPLTHMERRNPAILLEGRPPVGIPFEDIESVTLTSGGLGKWIRLGVGGALGLAVIWAVSHADVTCGGPSNVK